MKIIILAAGKGERLMPLTKNTPKPLLDMGNGATLLEEQIAGLQESGVVEEIALVIGYLAEQVEAKRLAVFEKRMEQMPELFAAIRKTLVIQAHQVEIVPAVK